MRCDLWLPCTPWCTRCLSALKTSIVIMAIFARQRDAYLATARSHDSPPIIFRLNRSFLLTDAASKSTAMSSAAYVIHESSGMARGPRATMRGEPACHEDGEIIAVGFIADVGIFRPIAHRWQNERVRGALVSIRGINARIVSEVVVDVPIEVVSTKEIRLPETKVAVAEDAAIIIAEEAAASSSMRTTLVVPHKLMTNLIQRVVRHLPQPISLTVIHSSISLKRQAGLMMPRACAVS